MSRLHLPHPHVAEEFIHAVSEGIRAGLHRDQAPLAETDPAVIKAWAEWAPPWQWESEHGGKGEA